MDDKVAEFQPALKFPHRNIGLDVLRSCAILLVLLSHFGGGVTYLIGWAFPLWIYLPGFFGVELFFVLSGFLIGSLLLDICDRNVNFRAWIIFLVRRWMRTVPAYLVFVAVCWELLSPQLSSGVLLSYITFTQNLFWPMPPGSFFAVSWSLTIEEWFYLLFSSVLFICVVSLPRGGFWIAVFLFLALPLILRVTVPYDADWDTHIR